MNPVHSIHNLSGDLKGIPEVSILTEPDQRWFVFLTFLAFIHHRLKEEDLAKKNLQQSTDRAKNLIFFFAVLNKLTNLIIWYALHYLWKQDQTSQDGSSSNILVSSIKYHWLEHTERHFLPHIRTPWLLQKDDLCRRWLSSLRLIVSNLNNTVFSVHRRHIQHDLLRFCVNSSVSRPVSNRQRIQRSSSDLPAVMLQCPERIHCSGLRQAFQREGGSSRRECFLLQCGSEVLFVFLT